MSLTPLTITFALYILLMLAIGFVAWRSVNTLDDYILGGRNMGSFVTALSAGASDMSGWLLLGLPGALFLGGLSESWIAIGLVLGAWCNWKFVAGPLRVYTERCNNALTLPDYFTQRFEDDSKVLRIISAVIILAFFAVYSASGIVANSTNRSTPSGPLERAVLASGNSRAASANSSAFECADIPTIRIREGISFATLRALRPIEPVAPRITTFRILIRPPARSACRKTGSAR